MVLRFLGAPADGGYGGGLCTLHGVRVLSGGGVALVPFSLLRVSLLGCYCGGSGWYWGISELRRLFWCGW
ncbi:hypothetical protein P8452_31141 [Trifolium repens]|nr:hypothetical protein P8452_31141 [Trifolium repens]